MSASRLHLDLLRRMTLIRERMHDESARALRVSELARMACLSEQQFVRVFRAAYGATPGEYLGKLRMAEAKRLLASGMAVTEVSFTVGYASLGSFSTRFARETRLSPRAFQRELRAFGAVPERLHALYVPMCFFECFASPRPSVGA